MVCALVETCQGQRSLFKTDQYLFIEDNLLASSKLCKFCRRRRKFCDVVEDNESRPLQPPGRFRDGITIFYADLDRSKIEVHRIPKMGRKAVDSNAIFIDGLFIPDADRTGEEGKGFSYILHSLNPERILVAAEAIGVGQDALRRAAKYARDRVVFDRPIGQNQGIQHPLAENWMYLESAWQMAMRAAWLYDHDKPCGAEANSVKFLGARAGHDAAWQAITTHGGFGYAKEYHVERLFREVSITRLAPITEQLILSFIAEKARLAEKRLSQSEDQRFREINSRMISEVPP